MDRVKKRKIVKTYQKKRRVVQHYKEKRTVQVSVKRRTTIFNYGKEGAKERRGIGRFVFDLFFIGALLGFFYWQRRNKPLQKEL